MFVFALFCLLAVGSQAKPLQPVVEPAQHIVIVTPQAQVHLEPALRYVHGLSPLARVSGPHHEETIVYVPAGAAASVVPTVPVAEAVSTGRGLESRQTAGFPQNIQQIQEQVQQNVETASGQFGEAAAAAAAAGAGFFPGFFPSPDANSASNKNEEQKKLKSEKLELIETPANTQPLLAATEARHFYSLPQVYHTPVVDVVHAPVYSWPISAIRARSIQTEEAPIQALQPAAEVKAAPDLPEAQPLIKEQKQPEQPEKPEKPLEQPAPAAIIPAAIEAGEQKPEIAGRQLEESNAGKLEQPTESIAKPTLKEFEESSKTPAQEAKPEIIAGPIPEARKETSQEPIQEEKINAVPEVKAKESSEIKAETIPEARKETSQEPIIEERKEANNEAIPEPINEANVKTVKEAIEEPIEKSVKQPIQPDLTEDKPLNRALPTPVVASVPEADVKVKVKAQPDAQPESEQTVKVTA